VHKVTNQDGQYSCYLNEIYIPAGNSLIYRSKPDNSVTIKGDKICQLVSDLWVNNFISSDSLEGKIRIEACVVPRLQKYLQKKFQDLNSVKNYEDSLPLLCCEQLTALWPCLKEHVSHVVRDDEEEKFIKCSQNAMPEDSEAIEINLVFQF
jgi:hypothetical protein